MPLNSVSINGEEAAYDGTTNRTKIKKGLTRYFITIEPIKFILGFTLAFTNGVIVDLIQRNVCHVNYNLTTSQCWSVNLTKQMEADIASKTAEINMLNQVAQGFFPLFLVLFIGPWSDTNGRKPFIIYPIIGYLIYFLSWTVFSFFPDIPVIYLFIPSIPLGLTGSQTALFACTWSYTCDNFEVEERPFRFSISICSRLIGGLLGNALAGQVVHFGGDYGYQIVFSTSFVCFLISLVYTVFCLEETIVREPGVARTKLIDFENIKSTIIVLFIRPEKGLLLSVIIFSILLCEIPMNAGDNAIIYLVGKAQYRWTLNDYNIVAAISSIISAATPVVLVWLLKKLLHVGNITLIIIGCTVISVAEVLKSLSVNEIMFWLSVFLCKIPGFLGPSLDAELSHIVCENNMGKAFTMLSVCEALAPLIAIPIYTLIYNLLLPYHTLYVYFLSASMATLSLILSVCLFFKKTSLSYTRQYNNEDTDDP